MFRVALLSLALAGAQLLAAGPGAAATSGAVRDGRDAKGKLDVASVSYKRASDRSITHTVSFYSAVASKSFTSKGNLLGLVFDTDGNMRADRLGIVVWADGALRGLVTDANGKLLALARVKRPNSRTVAITVPGRAIDRNGGYRWLVLAESKDAKKCRRGCPDTVPNTAPAVFDFTAPSVDIRVPDPYNAEFTTTAFAIHVTARDLGFSGVRRWTLESRPVGQSEWSTVFSGLTAEADVRQIGTEGTTYELRLTAVDMQGNRRTTTRLFSMPIDDANPLLAGAYGGAGWEAYVDPAAHLFTNTAHRATGASSTFTYAFTGTYVAWLGVPTCCPQASVSIDGGLSQIVSTFNTWKPFERSGLPYGPHTITIAVAPGSPPGFQIDGIVAR